MSVLRIPLTNRPQTFTIELGGTEYIIRYNYNQFIQTWVIDLIDAITEQNIISCLPTVTGVDLLSQHKHLNIKGRLWVHTDGSKFEVPSLISLGNESNLFYVSE